MDHSTTYHGYSIPARAFEVGRQPVTGRRAIQQRIASVGHALGKARRDEDFTLAATLQLERERLQELL